ncbi:MAG TPA: substrate-binding domain-containing protein [Bacteroidota bacterium]|nr:substrate-binding domain-containing protein [Bacteroidota bacterium]
MKRTILFAVLLLLASAGCQDDRKETPTKGRVTIVTAESVAPVITTEKAKFEELYPDAHVDLVVSTTREAIARFFNDSIKVIVTSRAFNDEERQVAKKAGIEVAEYKIAIDGVAMLVHAGNGLGRLRTTQLDSIFSGTIRRWSELGPSALDGPIHLYLPPRNSGTYEVVRKRILGDRDFGVQAFAAATSQDMMARVAADPLALGMSGINWVADSVKGVEPLALNDPSAPDSLGSKHDYLKPYQAYVYQHTYPIVREIYIYSRTDAYSVGNGFTAFVTSAPGQSIILKSGLVPATMPVRLVSLTNKGQ